MRFQVSVFSVQVSASPLASEAYPPWEGGQFDQKIIFVDEFQVSFEVSGFSVFNIAP